MQSKTLKMIAVSSEGAANHVVSLLQRVSGVSEVSVSLARNEVTVAFDGNVASMQDLQSALVVAGYGIDVAAAAHGRNGSCCGGCGG